MFGNMTGLTESRGSGFRSEDLRLHMHTFASKY